MVTSKSWRLIWSSIRNRIRKYEKKVYKKYVAVVPVKAYVMGEVTAVEIIMSFERFFGKFNLFITKYTAVGCIMEEPLETPSLTRQH